MSQPKVSAAVAARKWLLGRDALWIHTTREDDASLAVLIESREAAARADLLDLLRRAEGALYEFTRCDACGGHGAINVAAERKRYDCEECHSSGYSYVPSPDEVAPVLRDLRAVLAEAGEPPAQEGSAVIEAPKAELEARHARVVELAQKVIAGIDQWNEATQVIVGRAPNYSWGDLEALRAAVRSLDETSGGTT